ncbi:MAG: hypothetical protein DSZ28_02970 [Thiothrix sp.]|nr:MAG: hypothetical protein DSZ28_02970 [Thiothrix sp.]
MAKYEIKGYGSVGVKNTTEDKKNFCSDIIDCIDKYRSIFIKVLPILGLLASLLVTISLLVYADKESIDIFSYYSSWLSIMPIIAVVELLIAIVLIAIAFVPAFIIYLFLSAIGSEAASRSDDQKALYAYFYGLFAATVLFLKLALLDFSVFVIMPVIAPGFYIWFLKYKKAELSFSKKKTYFMLLVTGFIAIFLGYYFNDVYFSVFDVLGAIVQLVICFIGVLVFVAYHSGLRKNRNWVILSLFLVSVLLLFIMPTSSSILEASLRKIGLGGGVEKLYYVNSDNRSKIPDVFINNDCCDDAFCITNKLSIKWGAGDLIYVNIPYDGNDVGITKQHIAIPRNILNPYGLGDDRPPDLCKTKEELKESLIKAKKEQI